jgi:hypothetical protein
MQRKSLFEEAKDPNGEGRVGRYIAYGGEMVTAVALPAIVISLKRFCNIITLSPKRSSATVQDQEYYRLSIDDIAMRWLSGGWVLFPNTEWWWLVDFKADRGAPPSLHMAPPTDG